jgi:hydrogenase maturation protein HypF
MLSKAGVDVVDWLRKKSGSLPNGEMEAEFILNQLQKSTGAVQTTSCGRVLDAVSALLGICDVRSYEGEPAMKLESAAIGGRDVLELKPQTYGNLLGTSYLLKAIYDNLGMISVADLAYSAHAYIADGLATLAVEQAQEEDTKNVGFTGGAACNQLLANHIRRVVEDAGLRFWVHESVPAGDGGISFGQTVVASISNF